MPRQSGNQDIRKFFDAIIIETKKIGPAKAELEGLTAAIDEAGGIGAVRLSEKVTGGGARRELGDLLIRKDEAAQRVKRQERKVEGMKRDASRLIDTLTDPFQRAIMRQRYMFMWTWNRIADLMGYSSSYCMHAKTEAVEILNETFPDIAATEGWDSSWADTWGAEGWAPEGETDDMHEE